MKEKGILTKDVEKLGRTEIVELLELKGLFKPIAGVGILIFIQQIDDNFGEKIPEKVRLELRSLIHQIIVDKNYDGSIDDAFAKIDEIVNMPFMDDETEKMFFSGLAQFVKGILALYLKK